MSLSESQDPLVNLYQGEGRGGGRVSESGCGSRCFDCPNGNCINSCNFRTEADINITQKVSYGSLKKYNLFLHKLARGQQRSNPGWPNIQICFIISFSTCYAKFRGFITKMHDS